MNNDKNQKTVTCPAGVNLLDYLSRKKITVPAFCDGNGVCGRCRIQIKEGNLPVTPSDKSFLSEKQLQEGWRLACRAVTAESVTIILHTDKTENSEQIPEHIQTAGRTEALQHRYRIAISKKSIALVDMTAMSVTDILTGAEDTEILLKKIFEKYPDAETGLEKIISVRRNCFNFSLPDVEILEFSENYPDDNRILEDEIIQLFRIS